MTSSQYGPYVRAAHVLQWDVQWEAKPRGGQILKTSPSSDCSLKLDYMKLESLVKVYQLRYLKYVPGSCTHRPSHHGSELHPKLLIQPVKGGRHLRCDS